MLPRNGILYHLLLLLCGYDHICKTNLLALSSHRAPIFCLGLVNFNFLFHAQQGAECSSQRSSWLGQVYL